MPGHTAQIDVGPGLRGWACGYGWLCSCGARSHGLWKSRREAWNDHADHSRRIS